MNEGGGIKNLLIHSSMFEMYYKQKKRLPLDSILNKVQTLTHFSVIEIANARLCSRRLLELQTEIEDVGEVFLACCIISRKYWSDAPKKNQEEVSPQDIKRINTTERRILQLLNYNIGMTLAQIHKEIELEASIDIQYKMAIEGYAAHLPHLTQY